MTCTDRNILLIDDDPSHPRALEDALVAAGDRPSTFEWVRTLSTGLEKLGQKGVWAIFLNLFLPDSRGVNTLARLLPAISAASVVVLAGVDDEDICGAAMLLGARDYLLEGHIDTYAFARAIRNVTERESARGELFREKERAQVILDTIGDAVLITDFSGNVRSLSVVAERMTGWSMKEAAGHPLKDVFQIIDCITHKPSSNSIELAIRQNTTAGLSANCILIRRDGHECAIELSAAPVHDRDAQVAGAVMRVSSGEHAPGHGARNVSCVPT
jgi:PAS domain S-box-containing protein